MKVLYIVGACLTKNTSANMSHNAFLFGLIETGCQVDVLMSSDSWGETDKALPKYKQANYFEFNSVSFSEKWRKNFRTIIKSTKRENTGNENDFNIERTISKKIKFRSIGKTVFNKLFSNNSVYGNGAKWIKTTSKFKSDKEYDLIVSNSSPATSHKLTDLLIRNRKVKTNRWIQIWEDPWFYDLYGGHTEAEREEEYYLLKSASEIYYVSPLTLMYQKIHFADCADKMKCVPLPYLDFSKSIDNQSVEENTFGYFGDYYSVTRNLKPFYDALKKSGYKGFIYGDNDLLLNSTDNIKISGRVTLDILSNVQNKTQVLVHLSNLKGGQIPGKIYHYSATNKPILFILDGTEEEKIELRKFFGNYNRYYFCENNEEDIRKTMDLIIKEKKIFEPVSDFSPKEVVKKIIEDNLEVNYDKANNSYFNI